MKLYNEANPAPNPRRVRIFLAEKSISIPLVHVPMREGAHKSAEFKAKNSLGQVPVLELDDGATLSESIAICRYLEELHPAPALFGADPWQRANIEMWMRRIELALASRIGAVTSRAAHSRNQNATGGHASSNPSHDPLYRMTPERWLESMLRLNLAPLTRGLATSTTEEYGSHVIPRLDPRHVYPQVPAIVGAGDRGLLDLLGVTADGRLAVIELKADDASVTKAGTPTSRWS